MGNDKEPRPTQMSLTAKHQNQTTLVRAAARLHAGTPSRTACSIAAANRSSSSMVV